MNEAKIAALLGRPLSSIETDNFKTYLELATERVSDILCTDMCTTRNTKLFVARKGYRTLNVPIFTEILNLTLDGETNTAYSVRQGSDLNGKWFNSVVFDTAPDCQEIEITADWGFAKLPIDVQSMVAQMFGVVSTTLDDDLIQSKGVEDFRIAFKDTTKQDAFVERFKGTIAKYSSCVSGNVQSGNVYGFVYSL